MTRTLPKPPPERGSAAAELAEEHARAAAPRRSRCPVADEVARLREQILDVGQDQVDLRELVLDIAQDVVKLFGRVRNLEADTEAVAAVMAEAYRAERLPVPENLAKAAKLAPPVPRLRALPGGVR
jgi:hypothetical protein